MSIAIEVIAHAVIAVSENVVGLGAAVFGRGEKGCGGWRFVAVVGGDANDAVEDVRYGGG